MFPPGLQGAAADVMVTLFEGEPVEDGLRLAADLRSNGLRVEVYPEPEKLGKQFKYASARGIRFVTVVGGDERAAGQVTIKDMEQGKQSAASRAEVAQVLTAMLQ
jgi:histidyl-tRNA synthetase